MSHHKRIADHQIFKFIFHLARHLIDHGTFQMYHFVMGKHKNVFLTLVITHGKSHFVVIILAEIRIKFHIIQEIMHPSHIPFITEIQSVIFHTAGDFRPCRRFLSDHDCSRVSSKDQCIDMLKKLHCLKILIITVFIRNPLSRLLSIIQI